MVAENRAKADEHLRRHNDGRFGLMVQSLETDNELG